MIEIEIIESPHNITLRKVIELNQSKDFNNTIPPVKVNEDHLENVEMHS
jgi:hypothetical protein